MTRVFRVFAFARWHSVAVLRTGGMLLVAVGVPEVTGLWAELIIHLKVLISGWQTPFMKTPRWTVVSAAAVALVLGVAGCASGTAKTTRESGFAGVVRLPVLTRPGSS